MGIVAILAGGVLGGITALVALFGFGAGFGDAAMTYLLSGSIFAAGILMSMIATAPSSPDQSMRGFSGSFSG